MIQRQKSVVRPKLALCGLAKVRHELEARLVNRKRLQMDRCKDVVLRQPVILSFSPDIIEDELSP
jgi:hypothetical protein